MTVAARTILVALRVYKRVVSPLLPPACRFEPTCSVYAAEAVQRRGARRGAWLAVRRLVRCRPGVAGGYDPVPLDESDGARAGAGAAADGSPD